MKKYIKNPFADDLIKYGCKIIVTDGEDGGERVVEEYFITPEQIAEENEQRDAILRSRRVQG